jgi:hypothetical protein
MELRWLIRSPRRRANRGDAERLLGLEVDHQLGLRRTAKSNPTRPA